MYFGAGRGVRWDFCESYTTAVYGGHPANNGAQKNGSTYKQSALHQGARRFARSVFPRRSFFVLFFVGGTIRLRLVVRWTASVAGPL